MFSIIAAIGKNNELGKNNKLIFHIKDDMNFFREKTIGKKVIMGLNTWNSLPKKLKNRENIVISYDDIEGPDLIIKDLKAYIDQNKDVEEEIFVIGGGAIYSQLLPFAKNLYLTEIDASDSSATIFFPKFDKSKYKKTLIKKGSENGLAYTISKYSKT